MDIARALDINVEWLANGTGEMRGTAVSGPADKVKSGTTVPLWDAGGKTSEQVSVPNGVKAKKAGEPMSLTATAVAQKPPLAAS